MTDKNKLMNCFLIISLFIFIYIILVLCNIDRITDYNFWSEGSSPSAEVSKSIIIYIYPSLFIYIASCIFFIIKKELLHPLSEASNNSLMPILFCGIDATYTLAVSIHYRTHRIVQKYQVPQILLYSCNVMAQANFCYQCNIRSQSY